jgi:hypothetical protein
MTSHQRKREAECLRLTLTCMYLNGIWLARDVIDRAGIDKELRESLPKTESDKTQLR